MTELALTDQANTDLMLTGSQTAFTDNQVALLRQVGIEDATPADLDLFFHICRRTGLDPFARQIYMIGRDTKINVRVQLPNGNSRVEEQRVTKFTIQTGIDGYRLIGNRAARAAGQLVSHDDPKWAGKDGVWRDFWPKADGTPVAAKYTIRVDGAPYTAVCMFDEYAQSSSKGELTSMWKKMPANQLAKCAEAQAWRKAYPADFSGLILEGTDHGQVIDSDGAPARVRSERVGRGVGALRQLAQPAAEAEPVQDPAEAEPTWREKWLTRLVTCSTRVIAKTPPTGCWWSPRSPRRRRC
ncbi:hypothetical protein C1Y40_04143 [Mycobacterium talmoniae]|uniref:Phage recombination protein Bet n=1 Tax=Mycobacterium talmoniae TaxID=1858794 RepID=A0A2S8BGE8_9MYCO|nr:hypothetical protein C1Y40_04143 [Mycobacterium talmoniae]